MPYSTPDWGAQLPLAKDAPSVPAMALCPPGLLRGSSRRPHLTALQRGSRPLPSAGREMKNLPAARDGTGDAGGVRFGSAKGLSSLLLEKTEKERIPVRGELCGVTGSLQSLQIALRGRGRC